MPSLENAKTPCSLVFLAVQKPEYRAGFLNRVSQVRILPRAPIVVPLIFIDFYEWCPCTGGISRCAFRADLRPSRPLIAVF